MNWVLDYLHEAKKDVKQLDGNQQVLIKKSLKKVLVNPLSQSEGGFGKPLGKRNNIDLTGLYKIKLRGSGLRIIYKLVKVEEKMLVVVVGARADEEAYNLAEKRRKKHGL